MGNAPLQYQDELLTRIDQILRQLQAVQQPGPGAHDSQESVVRLRQENRDQDIVIGQLNERIHGFLQQRT